MTDESAPKVSLGKVAIVAGAVATVGVIGYVGYRMIRSRSKQVRNLLSFTYARELFV